MLHASRGPIPSPAIGNAFAWRSTDPKALHGLEDPVGPDNDAALARMAHDAMRIVVAWGANADAVAPGRARAVAELLARAEDGTPRPLWCLGLNGDGSPKHPLYLAAGTPLVPYLPR